ncbi:hypothetical protein [Streptomyces dysideae]|uniref:Uncharacterized protein n=1 Tax=Streptomyces dysideae TaxID=909626 RepID=A0A101V3R0_9ACTN|nr:hypothetical protein [Streptomyces dysideae]KUO21893.1 hypothetical protein AQJ91_07110 [Streptomyces dysideae]
MTGSRTTRWAKGTLVSAVAAVVCHAGWERLREWAGDVAAADPGAVGAGWPEGMPASATGLVAMPVLLWAGMRLLGERGNHLLVPAGVTAWWFIGGHAVEDVAVGVTCTTLLLTLFALLGGALSMAELTVT